MLGYTKSKLVWALVILAMLIPMVATADCCQAQIKQAEFRRQGSSYLLSADIDYQLSDKAFEALQSGVPLYWDIQIVIQRPRAFLWPEILAETTLHYRLQYHALLKMYRIKNESNGEVVNVSTLSSALALMADLHDFHLLDNAGKELPSAAVVAVKVNFDRDALPLPLRPMAYLSRQWSLSSEWTQWPLKN